jgi:hypothetical protein
VGAPDARSPRGGGLARPELQCVVADGDLHQGPWRQPAVEQHPGQRVVDLALDGAAQRPGAVLRLVAAAGQPVHGVPRELDGHVLGVQPAPGLLQQQVRDPPQLILRQPPEDDDFVDAVEELRAEVVAQRAQHLLAAGLLVGLRAAGAEAEGGAAAGDQLGAEVAGHHDHGVGEVHRAALRVGQPAVVEHLEQDVEDVRVRLSTSSSSSSA